MQLKNYQNAFFQYLYSTIQNQFAIKIHLKHNRTTTEQIKRKRGRVSRAG